LRRITSCSDRPTMRHSSRSKKVASMLHDSTKRNLETKKCLSRILPEFEARRQRLRKKGEAQHSGAQGARGGALAAKKRRPSGAGEKVRCSVIHEPPFLICLTSPQIRGRTPACRGASHNARGRSRHVRGERTTARRNLSTSNARKRRHREPRSGAGNCLALPHPVSTTASKGV
jgi:hypothetical protein